MMDKVRYTSETWYHRQAERWRKLEQMGWHFNHAPRCSKIGIEMANGIKTYWFYCDKNFSPREIHTTLLEECEAIA